MFVAKIMFLPFSDTVKIYKKFKSEVFQITFSQILQPNGSTIGMILQKRSEYIY